jgi:hypothetical protein
MTELLNTALVVMQGVSALVAPFFLSVSALAPAAPPPPTFTAVISAYSCDNHAHNSMYPCGLFRDGSRPTPDLHGLVAAGPYEWLGRAIYIEGYGTVRLVDTPRHGWYGDKPHIDLFLAYPDAVQWGIRERPISLIEEGYVRPRLLSPVVTRCRRSVGACAPDDLLQRGDSLYPERGN